MAKVFLFFLFLLPEIDWNLFRMHYPEIEQK